jgi:RecB family exonuclease
MNHLLARLVARIPERVTALVVAPESEAASFDELGRLRTAAWRTRDVPLALASWRVAEKPVDQAAAVGAALASFEGRFAADQVVLGVADEEVVPYLERQVARAGARTRRAAGTAIEAAPPFRLLRALERFLATRRFAELAALARDPELAPELLRDEDAPSLFDRYHAARLPLDLPAPPPAAPPAADGKRATHEAELARVDRAVATFQARLLERLGELASPAPRVLAEWPGPLRAFLESAYPRPLDPSAEPERLRAEALRLVGAALGELEALPAALLAEPVTSASALALLISELRGKRLPPAADGEARVELLGWLDLPLDDAPALVVTGFEEGRVPRSIGAHPFLPDGIRRRLGLSTDDDRLARDVYATTVLLASREASVFVTGRRNGVGDPLVPSRLAFHRPESEIAAAVRHFLPPEEEPAPPGGDGRGDVPPPPPFVRAEVELPKAMRVTSFKDYLASPYLYYLRHVERLDTLDDRAHELEPLGFGNLAHEVLQELGSRGPQDSDEAEIRAFLLDTLSAAAAERFRGNALPAVEIQLEQLRHRLGLFAALEAERRRAGWRLHAVEWTPPEERAVLEVDGIPQRLSGRIDRIDVHADGRWAILDYKAGENPADPRQVRRRDGTWTDLQLPLYRHVTRGLFPGEPELGYVSLGKDEAGVRLELGRWSAADLDEALEVARDVVRRVRARDFAEIGESVPYEPIFRSLLGESMLEGEGADE